MTKSVGDRLWQVSKKGIKAKLVSKKGLVVYFSPTVRRHIENGMLGDVLQNLEEAGWTVHEDDVSRET